MRASAHLLAHTHTLCSPLWARAAYSVISSDPNPNTVALNASSSLSIGPTSRGLL